MANDPPKKMQEIKEAVRETRCRSAPETVVFMPPRPVWQPFQQPEATPPPRVQWHPERRPEYKWSGPDGE